MDARLDTLSTELYQVNVHVGRIAQWQAVMGGFAPEASPPPPPVASDSVFKVFQKYRLSKSTCHKLSSCKVFQEFVLG